MSRSGGAPREFDRRRLPFPAGRPYNPPMLRGRPLLLATAVAVALLGAPPRAGADVCAVAEKTYEDTSVGFSILPIRGWEPKPRKNPDDPMARNDAGGWYAKKGDDGATCTMFRFGTFFPEQVAVPTPDSDAPAPGGDGKAPDPGGEGGKPAEPPKPRGPRTVKDLVGPAPTSFEQWLNEYRKWRRETGQGPFSLDATPAKFGDDAGSMWEGWYTEGGSRKALVGASVRRGEFEVAVLYEANESKNFVRDYRGAFRSSTKSLRILPEKIMRKAKDALAKRKAGAVGDAAWAEEVIASLPKSWTHSKSEHYVIVYDRSIDTTTPGLIKRIGNQLERLRAQVYEVLFPPARPVTALSVVKVTQDPEQYRAYGGPDGSAGYWNWVSRELVFFCKSDDYNLTLDVLNHEAFHQYIFYAVGQVSPHSWFNEGHGDYFAGFNLVEGKFKPGKFAWRQPTIREAIEGNNHVPLKEFLKYSQAEYYRRGGQPRNGGDVRQNYAQGWSLVYFLRTTKDPGYMPILDRYFESLKNGVSAWRLEEEERAKKEKRAPDELMPEERNQKIMEEALAAGFAGIDLDRLERDWIASKPY